MTKRVLVARLDARGQLVMPKAIRQVLRLAPGDQVCYVIQGSRVELMKVFARQAHPIVCFNEWSGEADTKGYGSL